MSKYIFSKTNVFSCFLKQYLLNLSSYKEHNTFGMIISHQYSKEFFEEKNDRFIKLVCFGAYISN